jgi:DNA-directed RNA polymerase II subunit RPB2
VPSIGDKFSCYSPDHDVLTLEHGWVPIAELTKEHKVASLVDGKLVYQNPTEIQSYDYKGKMYKLETNQVDLLVTPNHRMYVSKRSSKTKYEMPLAENVYGARRHYLKNVESWEPELMQSTQEEFVFTDGILTHFKLGDRALPIGPWLAFLGIWFAEGSSCRTHGYISISAYKPRVKEALAVANLALNFDIRMQQDKRGQDELNAWRIYEKDVFNFMSFMSCTKSVNKKLPQWVFALPRHLCQILLKGMLLGDGHTMTNGTERYDTSSVHLRDQFQQLCLHAGYSANACLKYKAGKESTKANGYVIKSTADAWRLTIVTSQNSPIVNKTVQQDSWVDYDGTVHCCTVPRGNGVIYVRRNGKVTWCGQSRHGQKGTIGMLYRQEDMPFTKDGIVPDIIVNPHAIPSRMTIAQLMECLMGKACTSIGTYGDATPFTELGVEDIAEVLQAEGLERYGNEILYNSRTGEQIPTAVFIGPTFYQRLKHMTCDKVHSRSNAGPIVLLTRQPSEGRAREGGLRIGEMEQEVHIAHGIQSFLKERFMESADNYRLFVCKKCGFMSIANPDANIFICKPCKNTTHFKEIRIPYAAKLLFQEMQTMSIGTRFITKSH